MGWANFPQPKIEYRTLSLRLGEAAPKSPTNKPIGWLSPLPTKIDLSPHIDVAAGRACRTFPKSGCGALGRH